MRNLLFGFEGKNLLYELVKFINKCIGDQGFLSSKIKGCRETLIENVVLNRGNILELNAQAVAQKRKASKIFL